MFSQSCPDFASGLTYVHLLTVTAHTHCHGTQYIYNTAAFLSSHGVSSPTLTRREWIMVVVLNPALMPACCSTLPRPVQQVRLVV